MLIEWQALRISRPMPRLWRRPMFNPFASTISRAEMSSPVDKVSRWRSALVEIAVALAQTNSTLAGICARMVLTSAS